MSEQTPRTLHHIALFAFTDAYWQLNEHAKMFFHEHWLAALSLAATNFDVYQNTDARADLLVWCALNAEEPAATSIFFEKYAGAVTPYRHLIRPVESLWGFSVPSPASEIASGHEIDPFATTRPGYLLVYRFGMSSEWYLLSQEARQELMDEQIRICRQYGDIRQLLFYSFGVPGQDAVVVYETEDLMQFCLLMEELRHTEAKRFTLQDAALWTGIYHAAAHTLALWK